jgi:inhibitor of KinA
LLTLKEEKEINFIHQSSKIIEQLLGNALDDIIPAYDSIALFSDIRPEQLLTLLENSSPELIDKLAPPQEILTIPICYDFGMDLERVATYSKLSIQEIIAIHLSGTYQSAMIGFQPGFTYATGLDPRLHCPRKEVPERRVPRGSVGIGGSHTGIYAFESPGGWNIIGRTPIDLFHAESRPPVKIPVGGFFKFRRITKKQFEEWEK